MNPVPPQSSPDTYPQAQGLSPGPRTPLRLALLISLPLIILLAFSLPFILSNNVSGRGGFDQFYFHEPTIRGFLRDWPRPDLHHYMSATTPGYHLTLTLAARLLGDSLVTLRLVSLLFSILLFALFTGAIALLSTRSTTPGLPRHGLPLRETLVLILPFTASMYLLVPAAWLQPDNLGWLLVLAVILLALRPRFTIATAAAGGALLLALVLVRQSHVWAAGVFFAAAWLGARAGDLTALASGSVTDLFSRLPARLSRTLLAFAATLPAFAAIFAFSRLWHGLTPPHFHNQYPDSHNAAAPAFILSLLGLYSLFFLAYLLPHARAIAARRWWALPLAALLGLLLAAIPETTYLFETRSSGLWNIVKSTPTLANHSSLLILFLAPLGAVAALCWTLPLAPRPRWIMLATLAGFTAAQTINPLAWQRYIEPLMLMLLPIMACILPRSSNALDATLESRITLERPSRISSALTLLDPFLPLFRFLGPLALASLLAMLTFQSLRNAEHYPPPSSSTPTAAHQTSFRAAGWGASARGSALFARSRDLSSSLHEPSPPEPRLISR